MFRFGQPEILYLLVLIPLLALVFYTSFFRKRRLLRTYGDPKLLLNLIKNQSSWRPHVKLCLCLLSLTCMIIALARPQFGTKIENIERRGIEAIIAIDISNSMLAKDVAPSRLEKAKLLFNNMVDKMTNDQVGIVVFAGEAFVQLPITNDFVSAKMFLDQLDPSMIQKQGTDIAKALQLCGKCFSQKKDMSRAIFVITDGEDHEGGAAEVAEELAKKAIHIYMLGVGSPSGAYVPNPNTDNYILDAEGNPVLSALNEGMCQEIAERGNGAYIYVDNSTSAQSTLQKYVNKLKKSNIESSIYSEYNEQYQGFLIIALVFLLIDVLLLEKKTHLFNTLFGISKVGFMFFLFALPAVQTSAQSHRDYVRRGNRLFRDSIYDKAQIEYQKGYQKDSFNVAIQYNLAGAMLRQSQSKEAMRLLEKAGKKEQNSLRRAMIYHNMGVILQSQKQFQQAIECYKESLRHNPSDNESRYNLILCQRQMKNQPQEQNKQDKNGGEQDKKDKNQSQNKSIQPKHEEEKQDNTQQKQSKANQMDRLNAEQLLNAVLEKERQTQNKIKQEYRHPQSSRSLKKQW